MHNNIDINFEARQIIIDHTENMMCSSRYEPESNSDLWAFMTSECAYILTTNFLAGKYTPMQYNDIRNKVADILNDIFASVVEDEHHDNNNYSSHDN